MRRVLVKHWIDLGRIAVRTTRGRVLIHGRLTRIQGLHSPLNAAIVEAIFADLQHIRGLVHVNARLDNWTNDGSRWREVAVDRHQTMARGWASDDTK